MDTSRADRTCRFELMEPRQLLAADLLPGLSLGNSALPSISGEMQASPSPAGDSGSIHGKVHLNGSADGHAVADALGLAGVQIRLLDETGILVEEAITQADGTYAFVGLTAGIYAVQEVQPSEYVEGNAHAGSGGGIVFESNLIGEIIVSGASRLEGYDFCEHPNDNTDPQQSDDQAIVAHGNGGIEQQSKAQAIAEASLLWQAQQIATPQSNLVVLQTSFFNAISNTANVASPLPIDSTSAVSIRGSSQHIGYAWQLSVVDTDQQLTSLSLNRVQLASTRYDVSFWQAPSLNRGSWSALSGREYAALGHPDAMPVAGDWDGDGRDEFGIFVDGDWYLDFNGNGLWDEADLWPHLGFSGDLPVSGDWNADGRSDIGVYGPIDLESRLDSTSTVEDAEQPSEQKSSMDKRAQRTLRHSSQGMISEEAVDHVFHYGAPGDYPVTGDWNGDGRETIAVFRDGVWHLDIDGDGKYTSLDAKVNFGQAGDLPVVGDWSGSGADLVGIYREGTWILDHNGNQQLDQAEIDRAFELGNPGDLPVVGDWDGDGVDEPAIYSPESAQPHVANRRAS